MIKLIVGTFLAALTAGCSVAPMRGLNLSFVCNRELLDTSGLHPELIRQVDATGHHVKCDKRYPLRFTWSIP